jgi:hypothetical protein
MLEIRPSRDADEFGRAVYGIGQYFGGPPTEELIGRFSQLLPFERMHAAFEGVAKLAGADPVVTFRYLLPLCAGLAIAAAYALAQALTGWRSAGYLAAAMTAWDLCSLINGLVLQINQPPPFALWVLTPAALLLFWLEIRHSRRAANQTSETPIPFVNSGTTAQAADSRTDATIAAAMIICTLPMNK